MSVPRIALLVIDDRGWIDKAITSFNERARACEVATTITVDDSEHRLGYCGAWQLGWEAVRESERDFDYVFGLESDFRCLREFDVSAMASILTTYPDVAQVALKRGPHGPLEEAAGGFMEAWPGEWTQCFHAHETGSVPWLRQRLFWTSNPALYPRSIVNDFAWPDAPASEKRLTDAMLFADRSFGYLGTARDGPIVEHLGTRIGVGY